MLSMLINRGVWLASMLVFAAAAAADVPGAEVTLVENAHVRLTRADFDEELVRRVPDRYRAEFAGNAERLTSMLNFLLIKKTLAAEARKAGLDREPIPQGAAADPESVLAQRFLVALLEEARTDFDRRIEGFTAKAREDYLVHRQSYVTKEQVEVSQLFVESGKRGDAAALQDATNARADLVKGADIAQLALAFPDDRPSALKLGRGKWISREEVDATLGKLLFDLNAVGDVTEPIRTRSGYYLFRLEGKRPPRPQTFDEVKDQLLEQLKQAYVDERRTAKNDSIVKDPKLVINQPAVDALVGTVDPGVVRKALQATPSKPPAN
jgi:peptidyl-prolyl cis-trans isomerase C